MNKYYMLRWKGERGNMENVAASENPVRIGQREDCDVLLSNAGPYADELFAVVRRCQEGDGWVLVPASEYVRTLVNGTPISLYHHLQDGDRITFSETEADITFEIRHGERFGTETVRFQTLSRRVLAIAAVAAVLVVGLVLWGLQSNEREKRLEKRDLKALAAVDTSVFIIRVDSLEYVEKTAGLPDKVLDHAEVSMEGTAFLDDRGNLITARHCIEPWLNMDESLISVKNLNSLPVQVRWAIEAETFNQEHGDEGTSRGIISHLSVVRRDGELLRQCKSSDFFYDDSRDEVVELGDFNHAYYRRSITGRFNRRDMMLGDIALLRDFGRKGSIRVAEGDSLLSVLVTPLNTIHFRGYPIKMKGFTAPDAPPAARSSAPHQPYSPHHMIPHDGGLTSGYSGGPAIVVRDGVAYAVGVISTCADSTGTETFSVPVSEIRIPE